MAYSEWRQSAADGTRTGWRSLVIVVVGASAALVVAYLLVRAGGVSPHNLATDPDDLGGLPVYYGAFALMGFTVWGIGIGGALVGALAARGGSDPHRVGPMLLSAAALTAYLVFDDMYQLHENGYLHLGIPQKLVMLVYVVVALVWLWVCREAIRHTEFVIAAAALAGFALSVIIDQELFGLALGPFVEDVPKIIGICLWSLWLVRSGIGLVRSQRDARASDPVAV